MSESCRIGEQSEPIQLHSNLVIEQLEARATTQTPAASRRPNGVAEVNPESLSDSVLDLTGARHKDYMGPLLTRYIAYVA